MNAQPGQQETDGADRHNSDGRHLQLEMAVESHAVQRPIAGCCMARSTEGIFLHTRIRMSAQQHRLNQLSATAVVGNGNHLLVSQPKQYEALLFSGWSPCFPDNMTWSTSWAQVLGQSVAFRRRDNKMGNGHA